MLVQHAASHNHAHVAKRLQVLQGVAVEHDEVGRLARLDGARLVAQPQDARVAQRGRMQRHLTRRAHDALEVHHLAPHVVLGDVGARRIGSQTYGDPRRQRLLRRLHDALEHDAAVHLLHLGGMRFGGIELHERKRRRDGAGQRRGAPGSVALEQRDQLVVQRGAVLDGVHAGLEAHAHALGAFDVRGGAQAQLACLVASRLRDLGRHAQHARLALHLGVEHASRDEQLHQVALVREAVAHDGARLFRRGRDVREQARAVAAGHRDPHAGRDQPRTRMLPRVDGIAHVHVGEPRIAHRAHGGHAAGQLLPHMRLERAAQVPPAQRVAHHLVDEVACGAGARGLARAAQVHVQVHQAGSQIRSGKVDLASVERPHGGGRRTHLLDDALVHHDGHVGLRLHALGAVEHGRMGENVGGHGVPFGWGKGAAALAEAARRASLSIRRREPRAKRHKRYAACPRHDSASQTNPPASYRCGAPPFERGCSCRE